MDPYSRHAQSPPTDNEAIVDIQSITSSISSENGTGRAATPSSLELRGRLPESEVEPQPRSAEKIINPERRMAWYGGHARIKTDEKDGEKVISPAFAVHLFNAAICLHWHGHPVNGRPSELVPYEGQIFILEHPATGKRMFVTANRNICSEYNKVGDWEECDEIHNLAPARGPPFATVKLPSAGWAKDSDYPAFPLRNGESWGSGLGICFGPSASPEDYPDISSKKGANFVNFLEGVSPHKVVTDPSVYTVGMKIGLVSYNKGAPNVDEEIGHLKDPLFVFNILGTKNETVVFTGKITYVGEKHIEYDCNSRGGCSGAAVFVLEKDHEEFGNVLAVHAGHKPQLGANLGFKLLNAFETY